MSRRKEPLGHRGEAILRGTNVPVSTELAVWLGGDREGDDRAARVFQQVQYHSAKTEDGWVAVSLRGFGHELGCGRMTVQRRLGDLVAAGILEEHPEPGPRGVRRYRPRWRALRELGFELSEDAAALEVRVAWAEALAEDRVRTASCTEPAKTGTVAPSQTVTVNPHGERDSGAENGSRPVPLEVEEDREPDLEQERDLPPGDGLEVGGRKEGRVVVEDFTLDGEDASGNGRAADGSTEHALRVLAKVGDRAGATRLEVLAHDLLREPDPRDPHQWAAMYAPDLPEWAVVRLREALRDVPDTPEWRWELRDKLYGRAERGAPREDW
jgi:hypothetical protein